MQSYPNPDSVITSNVCRKNVETISFPSQRVIPEFQAKASERLNTIISGCWGSFFFFWLVCVCEGKGREEGNDVQNLLRKRITDIIHRCAHNTCIMRKLLLYWHRNQLCTPCMPLKCAFIKSKGSRGTNILSMQTVLCTLLHLQNFVDLLHLLNDWWHPPVQGLLFPSSPVHSTSYTDDQSVFEKWAVSLGKQKSCLHAHARMHKNNCAIMRQMVCIFKIPC